MFSIKVHRNISESKQCAPGSERHSTRAICRDIYTNIYGWTYELMVGRTGRIKVFVEALCSLQSNPKKRFESGRRRCRIFLLRLKGLHTTTTIFKILLKNKRERGRGLWEKCYLYLFEVKFSYESVCPSVGRSVGKLPVSSSITLFLSISIHYWKYNFPMTRSVRLSLG